MDYAEEGSVNVTPLGCISVGNVLIDVEGYFLRRGDAIVRLEPRSWDVLLYLVRNPGKLVSKQELVDEVWRGAVVSDAAVSQAMLRVRAAVGDSSKQPSYVETVPRKGYRLIAEVSADHSALFRRAQPLQDVPADLNAVSEPIVGRAEQLRMLAGLWRQVKLGKPQVVFVDGDAGVGKSELVRVLVKHLASQQGSGGMSVAKTFCAEGIGPNQAYMPVYDLISGYGKQSDEAARLLYDMAPSWVSGAGLLLAAEPGLNAKTGAPVPAELVLLLRSLAQLTPLMLVVEDIQWCDVASLELLDKLINEMGNGERMMLITTRRTGVGQSAAVEESVAKLLDHQICHKLSLESLSEDETGHLVTRQLQMQQGSAAHLCRLVWHWTGGNPFYVHTLVDYLQHKKHVQALVSASVDNLETIPLPSTLVEAVGKQYAALSYSEQKLMAAASVAGMLFSVRQLVALQTYHGLEKKQVIDMLSGLQRSRVLRGTVDGIEADSQLTFSNALYRQVVYDHIRDSERRQLHFLTAVHLQTDAQPGSELAAVIGHHFVGAGLIEKAIPYLKKAARKMRLLGAESHAAQYLRQILALLPHVSSADLRDREELEARVELLGTSLKVVNGADTAQEVSRLFELMERDIPREFRFSCLASTFNSIFMLRRGDLARPVADALKQLTDRSSDPWELLVRDWSVGRLSFMRGEISDALATCTKVKRKLNKIPSGQNHSEHKLHAFKRSVNGQLAWLHLFQGNHDRALTTVEQLSSARSLAPGEYVALTQSRAAICMLAGDLAGVERSLRDMHEISQELGHASVWRTSDFFQFWADAIHGEVELSDNAAKSMWQDFISKPSLSYSLVSVLALLDGLIIAGKDSLALEFTTRLLSDLDRICYHVAHPELLRLQACALVGCGDPILIEFDNETHRYPGLPVNWADVSGDERVFSLLERARRLSNGQGNRLWLERVNATLAWVNGELETRPAGWPQRAKL